MTTPTEYFAQVVDDYRQNYAFNHIENIDWDKFYSENVGIFTDDMSLEAFASNLAKAFSVLHNEHWAVYLPNGNMYSSFGGELNFKYTFRDYERCVDTSFIANKYCTVMKEQYNIDWGITNENIGYICIQEQHSNAQLVTQALADKIFQDLEETVGIIIDIRSDEGGHNIVADRFLNYFADSDILYCYWEDKVNSRIIPSVFEDDNSRLYEKSVAALIGNVTASAAELFGYALKEIDNITLIGDSTYGPDALTTGGIAGDYDYNAFRTLENGVMYNVPSRYAQLTVDKLYAKYNPVQPDLEISPSASIDEDSDYVFEKAIGTILEKTDSNIYYTFLDTNTNKDLITHSAVEMVAAKYNMPNYHFTGTVDKFEATKNMGSWNIDFMKGVYFDESYYLGQKSEQLNTLAVNGKTDWTEESTLEAIQSAGMTSWEHFSRHGAFEIAADNTFGIDPSSFFDISQYYEDKRTQCENSGIIYTDDELVQIFQVVGLDPITHYSLFGFLEDITPTC